jgi:hypothetical protein
MAEIRSKFKVRPWCYLASAIQLLKNKIAQVIALRVLQGRLCAHAAFAGFDLQCGTAEKVKARRIER